MAKLIKANGEQTEVSPLNGKDFKLEELKKFVGGYIEILILNDDQIMVVNEEGKLKSLPVNEEATRLLTLEKGEMLDWISGDTLVCKTEEIE